MNLETRINIQRRVTREEVYKKRDELETDEEFEFVDDCKLLSTLIYNILVCIGILFTITLIIWGVFFIPNLVLDEEKSDLTDYVYDKFFGDNVVLPAIAQCNYLVINTCVNIGVTTSVSTSDPNIRFVKIN